MEDLYADYYAGYQLRNLRLINFHNFVDESIDIHGSLFLIGNNGTGKTTIVDAIQLALTGGQRLMYNAATVVGARAESGRNLASVILQHDFETGKVGRATGAIGYAAVELYHAKSHNVISMGVGSFVQSLDQRPELWGFIVEEPLKNIPLTIKAEGEKCGYRPVDRRELMEIVGRPHVYDIGRYRTQIANRFFGGRSNFERVADLLKASKSYKDLVVKARDFEGLFAFLLPSPDHQVFQDIESTLQSLDKIELDLKGLRQERDLLNEALLVLNRIRNSREGIERCKYLQLRFTHENVDREATQIQRAIHRNEQAIADAKSRLETVVPQLERSRTILAELRIGDTGRLFEEVERLEQEKLRSQEELNARNAESEAETTRKQTLNRERQKAKQNVEEALQTQLRILGKIEIPELPSSINPKAIAGRLAALQEAFRGISETQTPDADELRRHQNLFLRETDSLAAKVRASQQPLALRIQDFERKRNELGQQTIGAGPSVEFLPAVTGYAEFAAELDSKNIEWTPLYRLVDFRENTPSGLMDIVESYMGEAFLGTVFVSQDNLKHVVDIACGRHSNVMVADTAALSNGSSADVIENAVSSCIDCKGNAIVKAYIDRNLGSISLVSIAQEGGHSDWLSLDGIAYQGYAYCRLESNARGLLGSVRREKAVETLQNERRAKLTELESQIEDVQTRLETLKTAEEQLQEIRSSIEERISPWLVTHRIQQLENTQNQFAEVSDRVTRLKTVAGRITKQIEQLVQQIETIRTDDKMQTTGDVRKQIDTLKGQVVNLERERDRHNEIIARHAERLDIAKQQAEELDARRREIEEQLQAQRSVLHAVIPFEHRDDLDHYVDVLCEGKSIRPSKLSELIREHERIINREIGSLIGLEEEGHKGRGGLLHHDLLWTKYAFTYTEERNELRDQNDESVDSLFDKLVEQVESLESVVSENRRKLLEKTILGDLSNQYTRDLYRLRESLDAVNHMLSGLTFGRAQYRFTQRVKTEYRQVYGIVRRAGAIDTESQKQLKSFFESRLEQLRIQPDGTLPKFLDYRHWFDYQLHIKTVGTEDGIELTNDIRRLGSGGEQAVPNYLLIMAMSALLYNQIGSSLRVLLFDEAFYGIDAARREELLRFSARLGVHLVLATPEMDGVTEAMRESTTLLLEKNDQNEVFIGNFAWESQEGLQMDIFSNQQEENAKEAYQISINDGTEDMRI